MNDYIWILSTIDSDCNKTCKIGEELFMWKTFDKLVLTYEDGILNTTEISLGNKIVV